MDDASEERGLFARTATDRPVYLAADLGLAVARVADDRVGEVGVARRCDPHDVSAGAGGVAVATAEEVLVDPTATGDGDALRETGFGPAVAVGVGPDGAITAVAPSGAVGTLDAVGGAWADRGTIDGAVRAVAGPFVAADAGVFRLTASGPVHAGLSAVRDVTAIGVPRAATADGLFRLGNGWMDEIPGDFRRVAAATTNDNRTIAVAARGDELFAAVDGDWQSLPVPVTGLIADVGVAGGPIAVTESGCLLLAGPAGLRPFELGLPGVRALAVA